MRKFATNSPELRRRIQDNEQVLQQGSSSEPSSVLPKPEPKEHQVLGVRWDVDEDTLIFHVSDISQAMKETAPTKSVSLRGSLIHLE